MDTLLTLTPDFNYISQFKNNALNLNGLIKFLGNYYLSKEF